MTIFDQYCQQRGNLAEADKTPRTVLFSPEGRLKAMYETDGQFGPSEARTYAGLPWVELKDQKEDILVSDQSPGLFCQRMGRIARPVAITMKGTFGKLGEPPKTMIELVAQSLDAATLCDIIMHWLGQDPHWGDFEKALHEVVEKHGKFE